MGYVLVSLWKSKLKPAKSSIHPNPHAHLN